MTIDSMRSLLEMNKKTILIKETNFKRYIYSKAYLSKEPIKIWEFLSHSAKVVLNMLLQSGFSLKYWIDSSLL